MQCKKRICVTHSEIVFDRFCFRLRGFNRHTNRHCGISIFPNGKRTKSFYPIESEIIAFWVPFPYFKLFLMHLMSPYLRHLLSRHFLPNLKVIITDNVIFHPSRVVLSAVTRKCLSVRFCHLIAQCY